MQILLAILALSFLIIIHEFGHFIAAKLSGIKVLEFSLFMGPKLFAVQYGETIYSVRLIPMGGFVKMEGEEQTSSHARAYNKKPISIRAAVIAAGPVMNILAAIIILIVIISRTGFSTTVVGEIEPKSSAYEAGIRKGDKIISYNKKGVYHPIDVGLFLYASRGKTVEVEILHNNKKAIKIITPQKSYKFGYASREADGKDSNVVGGVIPGTPAERAGLQANDRVVGLNDTNVSSYPEINAFMKANKGKTVAVRVARNGTEVVLNITPKEEYFLGIGYETGKGGILQVVKQSLVYTYSTARSVYYSIAWLITGRVSFGDVMGPVGMVSTIGNIVKQSANYLDKILSLLSISAFISVNLGIFNLIPFPALDGSKLLLLAIEGVRRKAIPPEKEAFITMIGLVMLIMLMVFATYNDLLRTFGAG